MSAIGVPIAPEPEALVGVPAISWFATVGVLLALVTWDLTAAERDGPLRRSALLLLAQLLVAALFGAMLLATSGSGTAAQFFAGWGVSLAATVDLLVVLLSIAAGMRIVAVVVVIGVLARGALGFGVLGAPLIGVISVVFGAAVLWASWRAFRGEGDPPRPLVPQLANGAAVLAGLVLALLSAAATREVTGSAPLVLLVGVLALVGFRHVFALLRGLLERIPDASTGLAVVLVFIGAKSVLAGVAGPVHDPRVVLLTLGVVGTVVVLGAITAARQQAADRHRGRGAA